VNRASVFAWSGGGLSAYRIVMNHGTHLAFSADPNAADVQEKARAFLAANSVSSTEA
jgi:hypothetical protein